MLRHMQDFVIWLRGRLGGFNIAFVLVGTASFGLSFWGFVLFNVPLIFAVLVGGAVAFLALVMWVYLGEQLLDAPLGTWLRVSVPLLVFLIFLAGSSTLFSIMALTGKALAVAQRTRILEKIAEEANDIYLISEEMNSKQVALSELGKGLHAFSDLEASKGLRTTFKNPGPVSASMYMLGDRVTEFGEVLRVGEIKRAQLRQEFDTELKNARIVSKQNDSAFGLTNLEFENALTSLKRLLAQMLSIDYTQSIAPINEQLTRLIKTTAAQKLDNLQEEQIRALEDIEEEIEGMQSAISAMLRPREIVEGVDREREGYAELSAPVAVFVYWKSILWAILFAFAIDFSPPVIIVIRSILHSTQAAKEKLQEAAAFRTEAFQALEQTNARVKEAEGQLQEHVKKLISTADLRILDALDKLLEVKREEFKAELQRDVTEIKDLSELIAEVEEQKRELSESLSAVPKAVNELLEADVQGRQRIEEKTQQGVVLVQGRLDEAAATVERIGDLPVKVSQQLGLFTTKLATKGEEVVEKTGDTLRIDTAKSKKEVRETGEMWMERIATFGSEIQESQEG